jgi:SnoaL-like domain
MSAEQLWRRYAACWPLPASERAAELSACVVDDVAYLDPQAPAAGLDALANYMEGFARSFPGARFEIVEVLHHHDRSLARWRLRGREGGVVQTGASTAVHAPDGRLAAITGFFDEEQRS